jgi:hypothetical protein
MPINQDFPKNHEVIGKQRHADGEHFHFVWGPGRSDAETSLMRKQTKLDLTHERLLYF